MKYRTEIDGLRALAVIPVILFHAGLTPFSGGFVGVDVFFVISGYLITTILIEDINNQRYSIFRFYERRARRILPVLFFVLISTLPIAWLTMDVAALAKYGTASLATLLFASNFYFWRSEGYFEESAELNPLLHTWSLAVEEQFYLFFPLFLVFIWRFGKQKAFWFIVGLSLCSLVLAEWGWRVKPQANFYLAPTRAWELFVGSLVAFMMYKRAPVSCNLRAILGLLFIVMAIFLYDKSTPFPSVYTLLPVVGTALILGYSRTTFVGKVLSLRPIVFVGLISYSAYLWHQPIFSFFRYLSKSLELSANQILAGLALCFALSYLSWRFIETPFRGSKYLSRGPFILISLFIALFLGIMGGITSTLNSDGRLTAEQMIKDGVSVWSNMDERLFVLNYLTLSTETEPLETVVIGSSRAMGLDSVSLGESVTNVSVSSAQIQDYYAITIASMAYNTPNKFILGAEPWLITEGKVDNSRWRSFFSLYEKAEKVISLKAWVDVSDTRQIINQYTSNGLGFLEKLYKDINLQLAMVTNNTTNEFVSKRMRDGRLIYDRDYASGSEGVVRASISRFTSGWLPKLYISQPALDNMAQLFQWLQSNRIDVQILLAPYHPDFYEKHSDISRRLDAIEEKYRQLALTHNITLVGSYNPQKVGCVKAEFFDAEHFSYGCLLKVIENTTSPKNH